MIWFLIRFCKKVTDPYPPLPLALLAPQMLICRFCCKIKDPDPHPDPNKKVTDPQHSALIFQVQDSAAPVKNTGARYVVDEDRLLDLFRLVILLRLRSTDSKLICIYYLEFAGQRGAASLLWWQLLRMVVASASNLCAMRNIHPGGNPVNFTTR